MRTQLTVLFAALAISATTLAQTTQNPGRVGKHAGRNGQAFQGLEVTADQKSKMQSLRESQRSLMQALRSNTSLTEEQRKQQIRELRKANHEQMLAILTPEQQTQLKQERHQRLGRRAAFNAGRGLQALNLTTEQKSQLQPILQSSRQQMQALRADTSLTPQQKRERLQQIRQNQMSQMKSILTPEQQQQLQQFRGRRHKGGERQPTPPTA